MCTSACVLLIGLLNDLYVDPISRQHGLGPALLAACTAYAESDGALGLQLETQRINIIAQALYSEQGWEANEEFCTYHLRVQEH